MARPTLKKIAIGLALLGVACNQGPNGGSASSLLYGLQKLENPNLDSTARKAIVDKAYQNLDQIQSDSLKKTALLKISLEYLKLGDSLDFKTSNRKARELSIALDDSASVAKTYWDFSVFYLKKEIRDSAYYYFNKAQKIYAALGNNHEAGLLLLNMAIIQKNIRDYTGSEVSTIKAISLFKTLDAYPSLFRAYNNLGILYQELEEYGKSLEYYLVAEEYLDKAEMEYNYPLLWNNIGLMFKNSGQYKQAAVYFNKALGFDPSLQTNDQYLYAMFLDNLAHNQLKSGDTTNLLPQFQKALAIREKNNFSSGIVVSKLHLAEYFLAKKDTASAIGFASQAKELAQKIKDQRDLLAALSILSEADKENSAAYMKSYIEINQKIQERERATRNKFARIRYETAGYIAQTEKLNERIDLMGVVSVGILTILGLGIVIFWQNSKNREMRLVQQKQDANRQVYDLVLEQQKKIEEGRENEKTRIAKELHDGILGRLFGVRLNLDLLNERENKQSKEKRLGYIQKIQDIESEIRTLSHELSNSATTKANYLSVLKEFAEQQSHEKTSFDLEIEPDVDFNLIEASQKLSLFRIMQECVQNIQKHAKATKATISIWREEKELVLIVEDNGVGFDPSKTNQGIGLKNIRERVREMDGKLKIHTARNSGTKIEIHIPIN